MILWMLVACSAEPPVAEGWGWVPPGDGLIGSPPTEACRNADEDRVEVTLSRPLAIRVHETTQRDFKKRMGYNPSFRRGCPTCPVDSVTHHEAAGYCNALSREAGEASCYACSGSGAAMRCQPVDGWVGCSGYRLPTEAEWEVAARATTRRATHAGPITDCMTTDEVANGMAWYKANGKGFTQPVGQLKPNEWGLHDMGGNVYEWVQDWYAPSRVGGTDPVGPEWGTERVLKGGSWYHNAHHVRAANRNGFRPGQRLSYVGFRCVRVRPHE